LRHERIISCLRKLVFDRRPIKPNADPPGEGAGSGRARRRLWLPRPGDA